jgi:hypothetical protein
MNHFVRTWAAIVALSFVLCSCGSSSPTSPVPGSPASGGAGAGTGQVSLAITIVPPGVQCIQITATGSYTVTQNFAATPDAGTVGSLALGELPLGSVAITGQAFNVACASIASQQPSWVADKQVVNLQEGVVTSLTITFRPDNPVTGTPTFVGDVVQVVTGGFTGLLMSDGTVEAAGSVPFLSNSPSFVVVPGLSNVAQLGMSASGLWDCAALKSGSVECWGNNTNGELGNGTTTTSSTPIAVSGLANVTQISTGAHHTCALESSGALFCWGYNAYGQVGNNTTTNVLTPVQVLTGVASVSCGDNHTCAIQNGNVSCWGYNGFGGLGNNTTTQSNVPGSVAGLTGIAQLGLGGLHTCALRTDGVVFCWGYNSDGELGIGSISGSLVPAKVAISSIQQIGVSEYTVCARRSDATVWCWGYDYYGTVGDGSAVTTALPNPLQLTGLPPSASISLGYNDACSLGTDLSLECWGYNGFGEMANGSTNNVFAPIPLKP